MKLSVTLLQPGMVLDSPVYNNRGELLLNGDCTLTSSYIRALKRVGILAVNVQGIKGIDVEESDRILSDEVKIQAFTAVQELVERNLTKRDYKKVMATVQDIVDEILSGKIISGGLAEITAYDSYTSAHCVDVCVLSIAIGHRMRLPRETLVKLGMGGMLHDLGKTCLPLELINKPGKLTDREFTEVKKHSALGYKMANEEFDHKIDVESANIILNHHERYDGSGYPRGLKGDKLSSLDMICGAADMYNAMTTDRAYRRAIPYSEAYEMLLGAGDQFFAMNVVEGFAQNIVPYPVGTLVEMCDGCRGCVVSLNDGLPTRPVVKMLESRDLVDLREELSQVIKCQLSQEEASKLIMNGNSLRQ